MKYIFWGLFIFALIVLFPIPLKINLIYDKGILTLKLFNKTIIPSKGKNAKKKKENEPEKYVETPSGEKISKFKLRDIKDIFRFLMDTNVKFSLKTKIDIEYSIDDAALNAIAYGLIYQVLSTVHILLKSLFNVKAFKTSTKMKYNENFFKFNMTSIVIVNIAKIIYIICFIYYQMINKRDHSTCETSF